jgi:hypothetical protein
VAPLSAGTLERRPSALPEIARIAGGEREHFRKNAMRQARAAPHPRDGRASAAA